MSTILKFHADSKESYCKLAEFASQLDVTASLFPELLTVTVNDDVSPLIGAFIDDNGLNVDITVFDDDSYDPDKELYDLDSATSTLREIAEAYKAESKSLRDELTDQSKELDNFVDERGRMKREIEELKNLRKSDREKLHRVKERIYAIGILLDAISNQIY